MSSNPLIMGYGGGDFTAASCPGWWSGRCAQPVCAGCELWADRPGGRFSDDSALEVCIHETRYTNRRSYLFFYLISVPSHSLPIPRTVSIHPHPLPRAFGSITTCLHTIFFLSNLSPQIGLSTDHSQLLQNTYGMNTWRKLKLWSLFMLTTD